MDALKQFFFVNFEKILVSLIMVGILGIVYLIPYKLPFLNIFYLPTLLCAFYIGPKQGVIAATIISLLIIISALIKPELFINPRDAIDIWTSIISWSSFLILTSAIVGLINQKLNKQASKFIKTRARLIEARKELNLTSASLQQLQKKLDDKVLLRTQAIEKNARRIVAHKDRVEETLRSTMDPAVVKLIIAKKLRTENRRISVQFCDLKGFTSYAEEKPAEVVLIELNNYLAEMETILLQYHAHIDKYMGDGIMAEFGAPNSFAQHALLSVACSWKMQQAMVDNNFPWQLRVGIATGICTIGIVGSKRQAYTAFGDTVNLASRIEGLCGAGHVTVDEATYLECKNFFEFRQKSFSSLNQKQSSGLIDSINHGIESLKKEPENLEFIINITELLLESNDIEKAKIYIEKAIKLDPDNDKLKVIFANITIKDNEQKDMHIRGRKKPIHVYEVVKLKNPLLDFTRIPQTLYQEIGDTMDILVPFPEDLTLPVECMDGSVGFARMVGTLSYLIAERMQLDAATKKDILEAGYLSSIGKSIVPENILNRPGQLTDEEMKVIHMYPRESVRKLLNMGHENKSMLKIIEHHHEAMNGTGYPAGLSGLDIPLGSRILAVAEGYISLTSNRPYRGAWEVHVAFQELQKYTSLGKFDEKVMIILGEIIELLEKND